MQNGTAAIHEPRRPTSSGNLGAPPVAFVVAVWLGMPREEILRGLGEGWIAAPPGSPPGWTPAAWSASGPVDGGAAADAAGGPATTDPQDHEGGPMRDGSRPGPRLAPRAGPVAYRHRVRVAVAACRRRRRSPRRGVDSRLAGMLLGPVPETATRAPRRSTPSTARSWIRRIGRSCSISHRCGCAARWPGARGRRRAARAGRRWTTSRSPATGGSPAWPIRTARSIASMPTPVTPSARTRGSMIVPGSSRGGSTPRPAARRRFPARTPGRSSTTRGATPRASRRTSTSLPAGGATRNHRVVFGSAEADVIAGGDASDRIHGDAGDDWIRGGAGNDLIEGGRGDDALAGGRATTISPAGAATMTSTAAPGPTGSTAAPAATP